MALDFGIIALVLMAAVLHASWNALVKAGGDHLVVLALVIFTGGILAIPALPFVPLPAVESWPYLIASTLIHLVYYGALIYAYRLGDLNQVYPIARGSAPLLVAVGAWWLAGERLSLPEGLGVATVSAGIISLAWRRGIVREGETKAVLFALLTAATIGAYTVSDGIGVRLSGDPLSYILWLFALSALPLMGTALWQRRGRIRASFQPHLKAGIGGGIVASLAYGTVIWTLSQGPMAHIIALRETSVLIAAAIGTLILKEPFGRHRIAAAGVVAGGALLLNAGL